jgi:hypothetical protein
MKIKWNWGTKLTIAIILFMGFILTLVYLTTKNNIILVEKDYYPKGLAYQQRINSMRNAEPFRSKMELKQQANQILLKIPGAYPDSGSITFYRPNQEKRLDKVIPFEQGKEIEKHFDKSSFLKGIYVLKMEWWEKGKSYYIEEKIFINK